MGHKNKHRSNAPIPPKSVPERKTEYAPSPDEVVEELGTDLSALGDKLTPEELEAAAQEADQRLPRIPAESKVSCYCGNCPEVVAFTIENGGLCDACKDARCAPNMDECKVLRATDEEPQEPIQYSPSAESRVHVAALAKGFSMTLRGASQQLIELTTRLEIVECRFEGLMDVLVNNEIVGGDEVQTSVCQALHEAVTELEAQLSADMHTKVKL